MGIFSKKPKNETTSEDAVKTEETTMTTAASAAKVSSSSPVTGLHPQEVILRAHVTEKAASDEAHRVYTFVVAHFANKFMVATAVFQLFGVKPASVRILNRAGKVVRHGRSVGVRSDRKIARVVLKEGDTISVHTGV